MVTYSTPGVYVEEIPTLAPSVAPVATAIPVFIGYTQTGPLLKPTRINTLLDYESLFGRANPSTFEVKEDGSITRTDAQTNAFLMYYGISLYFQNGGGSCYILSVGDYSGTPDKKNFEDALTALEKEDEPTLIVLLDATALPVVDYYTLCSTALAQCKKLGDRFLIVDIPDGKIDDFRSTFGINNLSYAAAYHPYLNTTLNFQYQEDKVRKTAGVGGNFQWLSGNDGMTVLYVGVAGDKPKVKITADASGANKAEFSVASSTLSIKTAAIAPTSAEVVAAWNLWKSANPAAGFDIKNSGAGGATAAVTAAGGVALTALPDATLADLRQSNTALYNQIKSSLANQRVTLPPSAAIAGIYAGTDRDRGVWKAPANVSLNAVIGPIVKISDAEQDLLNIDPAAGKSINAIRAFTGKGTLVWGGRTLAGNDNEWRYVSVRRLFITIEESTRKASAFAVFEPNDATTWLKVKAMIESYLYGLWQQGALAGSKPESAYFVSVGLGKTMTAQDILEGRMIVSIGVAAVRPAEFIILRFSHKLQEA